MRQYQEEQQSLYNAQMSAMQDVQLESVPLPPSKPNEEDMAIDEEEQPSQPFIWPPNQNAANASASMGETVPPPPPPRPPDHAQPPPPDDANDSWHQHPDDQTPVAYPSPADFGKLQKISDESWDNFFSGCDFDGYKSVIKDVNITSEIARVVFQYRFTNSRC